MPAKYVDMGSYGHGVRFPARPTLDNSTRRRLYRLGLKKHPWSITEPQTYLGTKADIETIIHFIKAYNHGQYPQHQPAFIAYPPICSDEAISLRARL
jgi:hypothetical protein